ncbi:putative Aminoglycoside N(3')-acetyltransferase [Vibrio coralliirubri]|uniref:AAC(3) family N-acetyltransferase n=1 Tax=Vibrio TaxID=662 RepID=UPI000631AEDD|nr:MULTISPECIES: AAC(3) family N-acetyltransferase [Vibrio]PQJ57816.1 hypothetical protein BTO12_09980 [Vibrio splendidus]CDT25052.1 putative Aminoglycoside N(3')-acetyltransferase [Vibrio coralliirubri]
MLRFNLFVKGTLRKMMGSHPNESFFDSVSRNKFKILKAMPHHKYGNDELRRKLVEVGVRSGDCLMVHSSWRSFVGYSGCPESVINIILDIIGERGTLLMPSNSPRNEVEFDVVNSANVSGVLSNVFSEFEGVERSCGSHFSVSGKGYLSKVLLQSHPRSLYGFDEHSPYGKFCKVQGSKVIFLGLGKKPTKISLLHRIGYEMREKPYFCNNFINGKHKTIIDKEGIKRKVPCLTRVGLKNSNSKIRKIIDCIPNKYRPFSKVGHLDIVAFDTYATLDVARICADSNLYMYNKK